MSPDYHTIYFLERALGGVPPLKRVVILGSEFVVPLSSIQGYVVLLKHVMSSEQAMSAILLSRLDDIAAIGSQIRTALASLTSRGNSAAPKNILDDLYQLAERLLESTRTLVEAASTLDISANVLGLIETLNKRVKAVWGLLDAIANSGEQLPKHLEEWIDIHEDILARAKNHDLSILDKLSKASQYEVAEVRHEAIAGLRDLGGAEVVEPLIKLLEDSDHEVNSFAADVLGALGDQRAIEPLRASLDRIKDSAADALRKMGDRYVVQFYMAQLHHEDKRKREQAAWILHRLADPESLQALIQSLQDSEHSVRRLAALALGELRDRRAVEPLIVALISDKEADPPHFEAFYPVQDDVFCRALFLIGGYTAEQAIARYC